MNETMIEARDLCKRFGDFTAVDRVSFEVPRGQVFGFLGPNGAGKTTTIRMLCGILLPSSGTARVAGADVSREPERVKARIGYMSQRFTLYPDLTVVENISFYGGVYRIPRMRLHARTREMIAFLGLEGLEDRLTRDLAGGHRQRLALACAILHEPPVVFLDEPTSGVDPVARRAFWDLIYDLAERGTTLLVTTHYLDEAEYCERLAFIGAGRLIAIGTPSELKQAMRGSAVFVVEAEPQDVAIRILRGHPDVISATPFGPEVHVVARAALGRGAGGWPDSKGSRPLHEALQAGGLARVSVREVPPSLEDVFIHLVRGGVS